MDPITAFFTFMKSPLVKWVAIIAIIVGLVLGIYYKGRHDVQVKWDAENERIAAEEKNKKEQSNGVTDNSNSKADAAVKTITVKGDTIVKYVNRYITKESDAGCTVPLGFVRMHDDSVKNDVSGTASQTDVGPTGIRAPVAKSQQTN